MVHELNRHHSIFNQFMREIRDEQIQKDSMRFRRNIERIGEVMAYEISKSFEYAVQEVTTPLGVAEISFSGHTLASHFNIILSEHFFDSF